MNCPKCHKSDEVVTRADGRYCLDCGERVEPAPLDAAACSASKAKYVFQWNFGRSQFACETTDELIAFIRDRLPRYEQIIQQNGSNQTPPPRA